MTSRSETAPTSNSINDFERFTIRVDVIWKDHDTYADFHYTMYANDGNKLTLTLSNYFTAHDPLRTAEGAT